MDREALAWAAGFWDGEGSCWTSREHRGIEAQLGQSDREVLDRFHGIIGIGTVYGPYGPYGNSKKPLYQYLTSSEERVQALMAMLWPWLGTIKRQQFAKTLADYRTRSQRPYVKAHPRWASGWHYEIVDGKRKQIPND